MILRIICVEKSKMPPRHPVIILFVKKTQFKLPTQERKK